MGGFGGGGEITASGGGGVLPAVTSSVNCQPTLNQELPDIANAEADADTPVINLAPVGGGTYKELSSMPACGSNADPLPFFSIALSNLGLIGVSDENSGLTPSQTAEVVPTLSAYDLWQADIAAIAAIGAGDSEIAGDLDLLAKIGGYLQAITTAENALFGGDANWLSTKQTATLQQWITDFFTDAQSSSDGGETITPAEQSQLLATTLPSGVSTSEANEFIDRWNRTVEYWSEGITIGSEVPAGQSTDFLDACALQTYSRRPKMPSSPVRPTGTPIPPPSFGRIW